MSWEGLPTELQVFIVSKLPFSDLLSCRRVNKNMKDIVDDNKRLMAKRTINLVKISCEEEFEMVVWNKEQRKRKRFEEEFHWSTRRFNRNGISLPVPACMAGKLSRLAREAIVKRLELFEITLTEEFIKRLMNALPDKTIETIEINMSSFHLLLPDHFLRFLNHFKPVNLRIGWIRLVPDGFFYNQELIKFFETRQSLELINITNYEKKPVHIPLDIRELFRNRIWSFHLDNSCAITPEDVSNLVDTMTSAESTHHVRLECDHPPPDQSSSKGASVQIFCDEYGVSARKGRK